MVEEQALGGATAAEQLAAVLLKEEEQEFEQRRKRAANNAAKKAKRHAKKTGKPAGSEVQTHAANLPPDIQSATAAACTGAAGLAAAVPQHTAAAASCCQPTRPQWMTCPLTQEVMKDPVLLADGHTYERAAAEAWLAQHDTSPVTGQPLTDKSLQPNHALYSLISPLR